jgi:hypothetical protein
MAEVHERLDRIEAWHRVVHGARADWDSIFEGFQSTVDWPAFNYWRELAGHYPDAKVLLSVRDAGSWYKSISNTIYPRITRHLPEGAPEIDRRFQEMANKLVVQDTFGGQFEDKQSTIGLFNRHIETVRAMIDSARLLVFDVREGWEPLCRFFGVPIPDEPFPRLNDTASFQESEAD